MACKYFFVWCLEGCTVRAHLNINIFIDEDKANSPDTHCKTGWHDLTSFRSEEYTWNVFFLKTSCLYLFRKKKQQLPRPPLRNINMTWFKTNVPEWRCFVVWTWYTECSSKHVTFLSYIHKISFSYWFTYFLCIIFSGRLRQHNIIPCEENGVLNYCEVEGKIFYNLILNL